jgi:hypothetical protein
MRVSAIEVAVPQQQSRAAEEHGEQPGARERQSLEPRGERANGWRQRQNADHGEEHDVPLRVQGQVAEHQQQ